MGRFRNYSRPSPPSPELIRIALWGPTGAGKSWLIHAFARELELLSDDSRPGHDPEFRYSLFEHNLPFTTNPEDLPVATATLSDKLLRFRRQPRPGFSRQGSEHQVLVHDNMGGLLVNVGVPGLGHDGTEITLAQAKSVIVLLDAGSLDTATGYPAAGVLDTDAAYVDGLRALLGHLRSDSVTVKHIAVCLSKVDYLTLIPEPDNISRSLRSTGFRQTLEFLRQMNGQNDIQIEFFNTSAVGYLRHTRAPNFNPANGELAEPRHWRPFNAAAPFFWIFQQLETAGMSAREKNNYPTYPRPH